MPFKKGQSGNAKGRPKAKQNESTLRLRETISDFLIENFDKIRKDFVKLSPKDRGKLYADLLQYGLPKLQNVSADINFEGMTDEQLDLVIERLKGTATE